MKIKIISDGTAKGTQVIDTATGEPIEIEVEMELTGEASYVIWPVYLAMVMRQHKPPTELTIVNVTGEHQPTEGDEA